MHRRYWLLAVRMSRMLKIEYRLLVLRCDGQSPFEMVNVPYHVHVIGSEISGRVPPEARKSNLATNACTCWYAGHAEN